ncbi:AcrR family transcriptional regulator [Nonomuraea thailandensis]|uniref:AcrR family transcriptional regulator n=1 Tax=Nonomuraea thailandensis TaxID=1188745 RepID=A0A9X2GSN3_9ACTN|nr:TetR/AcrR family transcriptional regulator [Nonomuraea thailandensis]MCP2361021.1 AcrR family transcriptional regulator [Nonomuraea thailandensis]
MGTRDRIIDAAEQAIHEYGIAGATTKRIAQRASCSEALLYKHFAGKEELFLAVLLERMPALGPALTKLRLGVGERDLRAGLVEFTRTALEFYTRAAAVAGGVLGDPPLMAGFRSMLAKNDLGPHLPVLALAEILRAERQAGRIGPGLDPGAAASLLMGACFHRANLAHFVDLPDDDATWAASIVDTLFRR